MTLALAIGSGAIALIGGFAVKHTLLAAASVAALLASAAPGFAQYAYPPDAYPPEASEIPPPAGYPPRPYPPRQSSAAILAPEDIAGILRSMGLNPVSQPRWRPGQYVVRAIDRRGMPVRVISDAYTGRVREVIPLDPEMRAGFYPGAPAPYGDEDITESIPRPPSAMPPRVIPAPSGALSPPHNSAPAARSAALTPPRTPLPRPRPPETTTASKPQTDKPASAPSSDEKTASGPAATPPAVVKPETPKADTNKGSDFPPVQPLDDASGVRL